MQFVARQPVFDRGMRVFGYELLFRRAVHDETAMIIDGDRVSRQIVDTTLVVGLETLCDATRVFINCTRDTLTSGVLELLPPHSVVAEVLEDVVPDEEVIAACRKLREKGFLLALDDVVSLDDDSPLSAIANFIKVDFRQTTPEQRLKLARKYVGKRIALLAEKVETYQEQIEAQKIGFEYFQGYFFQKPRVMATEEISALHLDHLQLLAAVNDPAPDLTLIEQLIKMEPALSYRLLRYMNSPLFAFTSPVVSVRHALVLLGFEQLRKWVSVVALVAMGGDKPLATVVWALIRARYCELLGERVRGRQKGMFLLGLISSLPTLLDLPIETIVNRVPVSREITGALLGEEGRHKQIFDLVLAYEAGAWEKCAILGNALGVDESQISQSYVEAVKWAQAVSHCEDPEKAATATS
jgi:EAL and modified HD-GYP domain-containing signal transduction protein